MKLTRPNLTRRQVLLAVAVLVLAGIIAAGQFLGGPQANTTTPITVTISPAATSSAPTPAGPATTGPGPASPTPPGPAGTPSSGGDGDDGGDDPPIVAKPTTDPAAQEAATAFTAAWLNTYKRNAQTWRDGLTPRVTPDLADDLAYADPESVPAGGKVTATAVTVQGSLYGADAPVVTADAKNQPLGTLHLTLVKTGGTWLISEIDWQPKR